MNKKRVAVVGAGITGLTVAYRLSKKSEDFEVVIFETDEKVGGKLRTSNFAGFQLDEGADAFLARAPWAVELFDEVGISEEFVSPRSRSASIWANGSLIPLPSPNVLGIPLYPDSEASDVLSAEDSQKIRDGGIPENTITGETDISIGSLVRNCVGDSVFENFVDPLLSGINAGKADAMSCATMAPHLLEAAMHKDGLVTALKETYEKTDPESPVFYTHPEGMGHIVKKLAEKIVGSIRKTENVTSIEPSKEQWIVKTSTGSEIVDAVVLTNSAQDAANLLHPLSPTVSTRLSEIEHASVSLVSFAYETLDVEIPENESGFLVPRSSGKLMTACSFSGNKWTHLNDGTKTLMRVSTGRIDDQRHETLDDEELVECLMDDLKTTLGVEKPPLEFRINRWPKALAQFEVGHLQKLEETLSILEVETPGIFLSGSYHFGVGIPASIRSGNEAATRVLERFGRN